MAHDGPGGDAHRDAGYIQAHVGGAAATEATRSMGAQAYEMGDHVAFGAAPDLHTAAHEPAHIVQQCAGVHLKANIGASGGACERHADAVADRVVRSESAEGLLDQMTGGRGKQPRDPDDPHLRWRLRIPSQASSSSSLELRDDLVFF